MFLAPAFLLGSISRNTFVALKFSRVSPFGLLGSEGGGGELQG